MGNNSDIALLISTCDLYEDAWNPFFRLLQENWPQCPYKIYLLTEAKTYVDPYFDVVCIHSVKRYWSDRMMFALEQIKEQYLWFFLEDFFLEEAVNIDIVDSAVECIKNQDNIGVIRFIPEISSRWYDDKVINNYFSPIPRHYVQRSNLMLALYKKDYFQRMLRKNETPWDFEKFGKHRSRIYDDEVLIQNVDYPLAFPYNYSIRQGVGISARRWLPKTKELFERYQIDVDFENLGWYKPPIWVGMTRKQKIQLLFTKPSEFFNLVKIRVSEAIRDKIHLIKNIKDYM